jgi:hypothetical protein
VVGEEVVEDPFRIRSRERDAGKEILFIRDERGFNVTEVGGNGR